MYIISHLEIDYNMKYNWGCGNLDKFKIDTTDNKLSTVSRTIRIKEETFDRINEINRKTGVSFNKIVNQCIEYALERYEEE